MLLDGIGPDCVTFSTVVSSCSSSRDLARGKLFHGLVVESGNESDLFVGNALVEMYRKCGSIEGAREMFFRMERRDNSVVENALVSMYVKCGSLQEARKIFDGMEHRNVITWTAMVAAFAELGKCKETLVLFQKMQAEGVKPNKVTLSAIVNWCAQLGSDTKSSKLVEMCVEEAGLELELIVANALLNLYAKSARLRQAFRLFNRMPQRDSLSWNLVISSHAQHGFASESLLLFQRMKQEGMKPDGVTFLNIIAACGHCGEVEEGCRHFGCLEREYGISPTAEQRGCVVDLLGRAGRIVEAREFIAKNGLHSSVPAWMSVLGACRALGNVEEGKAAADKLVDLDPQNSASYVMLSNLYAR
ncbi:hypothetical protein SELMODRAFT_109285 [Selaginella moellendorffii]|uniref:Pentacotripeptide-repeat region of PRORP domain-containing protein n=1 Tax=Selaginella moellendorffii TaxID=88036 RepID=D8S5L7_SELML|nr:hypothetical protein SELMODRAFT_109285 [Selaginella moellendorffii]